MAHARGGLVGAIGHPGHVSVDETQSDQARLLSLEWPKRTQRLVIRPAVAADAQEMWEYRRREEVSRWLTSWRRDRDDWIAWQSQPDKLAVTVIIELDGAVIGDLMLRIEDAWAQREVADGAKGVQAELGWALHPDHVGHGYATEAVRELIRICFEDLGLRRVVGNCFADNEASWRLMERLGMRREEHAVRESLHRDLGWLDGYRYAMLAEEWPGGAP